MCDTKNMPAVVREFLVLSNKMRSANLDPTKLRPQVITPQECDDLLTWSDPLRYEYDAERGSGRFIDLAFEVVDPDTPKWWAVTVLQAEKLDELIEQNRLLHCEIDDVHSHYRGLLQAARQQLNVLQARLNHVLKIASRVYDFMPVRIFVVKDDG